MLLTELRQAQAVLISQRDHIESRMRLVPDVVRDSIQQRARDLNRRIAHLTVQITQLSRAGSQAPHPSALAS
jgi:hypothetical protein